MRGAYEQTVFRFAGGTADAIFEPRFVSYGFRYLQMRLSPAGVKLAAAPDVSHFTCWAVHTELQTTGRFAFAQPEGAAGDAREELEVQAAMQRNYDATILTAEANYISYPTDCPHRERRGWLGDAQAAASTLLSRWDMAAAYTKWLRDVKFAAARNCPGSGGFPTLAPNYAGHHGPDALDTAAQDCVSTPPAWAAGFVLVWDWTWRTYSDLGLAAEHIDRARKYLDTVHATVEGGIVPAQFSHLGDWCAALGVNGTGGDCSATTGRDPSQQGDPSTCFSTKHVSGIQNTFFLVRTTEAWLRAHRALGRPAAEAAPYQQTLAAARKAFNDVFFDAGSGSYIDAAAQANASTYGQVSLQTSLALALTMDAPRTAGTYHRWDPTVDATPTVQASLKKDVTKTMGGRMSTGLIGTRYLLQALSDAGDVDTAIDLLTQRTDPSWGYMLDQGPGTLWEQFLGNASWVRARGSLNHIMLGSQGAWFFDSLAGLRQADDSVGWSSLTVAPALTKRLQGFGATMETVRGTVAASWAWVGARGERYWLNATVPVTSNATITFPEAATVMEGGVVVFSGGKTPGTFRPGVPGVTAGRCGPGWQPTGAVCAVVEIEVQSGDYAFEVVNRAPLKLDDSEARNVCGRIPPGDARHYLVTLAVMDPAAPKHIVATVASGLPVNVSEAEMAAGKTVCVEWVSAAAPLASSFEEAQRKRLHCRMGSMTTSCQLHLETTESRVSSRARRCGPSTESNIPSRLSMSARRCRLPPQPRRPSRAPLSRSSEILSAGAWPT